MISRVSFVADPSVLLTLYQGLIRTLFESGAVFFLGASMAVLRVLDRVPYAALRVALACMRLTPIPVLLLEANEPPLGLRRWLLANHFMARNFMWRNNPLIPKLQLLSERAQRRAFKINLTRCGLLISYEACSHLIGEYSRTIRPAYFDIQWMELSAEFLFSDIGKLDKQLFVQICKKNALLHLQFQLLFYHIVQFLQAQW